MTLEELGYKKELFGKSKILYKQVLDEEGFSIKAVWFDKVNKVVKFDGYFNLQEIEIIYNLAKQLNF